MVQEKQWEGRKILILNLILQNKFGRTQTGTDGTCQLYIFCIKAGKANDSTDFKPQGISFPVLVQGIVFHGCITDRAVRTVGNTGTFRRGSDIIQATGSQKAAKEIVQKSTVFVFCKIRRMPDTGFTDIPKGDTFIRSIGDIQTSGRLKCQG